MDRNPKPLHLVSPNPPNPASSTDTPICQPLYVVYLCPKIPIYSIQICQNILFYIRNIHKSGKNNQVFVMSFTIGLYLI